MPRKSYRQFCGVARALDVVGERWTLLIARNLLLGPRRYSDLLHELPGITTNLLAKRLHELESAQLIAKELLPAPLAVSMYRLTPAGRALEPVIMELGRWGGRLMSTPLPGETVNLGWAFLSMKRRYRGGLSCSVEVRAGERRFALGFSPHALSVEERAVERADLSLSGEESAIRALFFQGASWQSLERTAEITITGSKALLTKIERALAPAAVASSPGQEKAITRRKLSSKNSSVSSKRSV